VGLLNVVTGRVTNPSTTITALTANTGDSFTVKAFDAGSKAYIVNAWCQSATAGVLRIRSPRLHDNVQGIRLGTPAAKPEDLLPTDWLDYLASVDTLTVEASGGASETDVFSYQIFYESLGSNAAKLISVQEYLSRYVHTMGQTVQLTSSATAGQYGGTTALNATADNWQVGYDYALLGAWSDTAGCTIGISGPDTGQVRIGIPMSTDPIVNREYFVRMSLQTGKSLIPVISSQNRQTTNVDVATTSTSATVNLTLVLSLLSGPAMLAQAG